MGETLNLLFRRCEDGAYKLQAKESRSGRVISGSFVPPYQPRQLNSLLKKLNTFESDDRELREIGQHLYQSLFGPATYSTDRRESSEQSIRVVLRSVIQGALARRGSVALTLSFTPECHEFVRYPWELLHNGEHFLLASGVFTLTRALVRPEMPSGSELPGPGGTGRSRFRPDSGGPDSWCRTHLSNPQGPLFHPALARARTGQHPGPSSAWAYL